MEGWEELKGKVYYLDICSRDMSAYVHKVSSPYLFRTNSVAYKFSVFPQKSLKGIKKLKIMLGNKREVREEYYY